MLSEERKIELFNQLWKAVPTGAVITIYGSDLAINSAMQNNITYQGLYIKEILLLMEIQYIQNKQLMSMVILM